MGIASLVLGIITILFSFIPFVCFIAPLTGTIAFILGIIDIIKKGNSKYGMPLAGIILTICSVGICVFMSIMSLVIIEGLDEYGYNNDYYDYYEYNTYDKYQNNSYKNKKYNRYNKKYYTDYTYID